MLQGAAQSVERDPKTDYVVRNSPCPTLGVLYEDPAAQLLIMCREPRRGQHFNVFEFVKTVGLLKLFMVLM